MSDNLTANRGKIGLVILTLLSLLDILGPWIFPAPDDPDMAPPGIVEYGSLVCGVLTLIGVFLIWTRRNVRASKWLVIVTRIISALTGVPAFFISGVPGWVIALVAVFIVLTVVGLVLVWNVDQARNIGGSASDAGNPTRGH